MVETILTLELRCRISICAAHSFGVLPNESVFKERSSQKMLVSSGKRQLKDFWADATIDLFGRLCLAASGSLNASSAVTLNY